MSFGEEKEKDKGGRGTNLQNANEAEVILLNMELNVLKGPSRDNYPKLLSENATETLVLHRAHNTIHLPTGRLTHARWMSTVKEFPLREE